MWSDNETKEDLLGYHVHASLLKDVILDSEMLPTSIGVFGNWGAGKSSLMLLLQEEIDKWAVKIEESNKSKAEGLKENNLILQVYFNSWKYENYETAKNTLIIEILEALSSDISNRKDLFEKADDLLKRVNLLRGGMYLIRKGIHFLSESADVPAEIMNLIPTVEDLKGFLNPDEAMELLNELKSKNTSRFISKFRDLFEAIVLSAGYRAVVVYIDDLDRCNPNKVVDCLEAIKLFLNVANTAFVISADERIVELAIQDRYHVKDDKNDRFSPFSDYLEKLIQLPYKLPKLSFSEQETYITLLLCKWLEPNLFPKIHKQYLEFREKDKHTKYSLSLIRQNAKVSRSVDDWMPVVPLMNHFLNGNPRQLKRFLNTMHLRMRMAHVAGFDDVRPDVLAKLMVFEYKPSMRNKFEELFNLQLQNSGYLPDVDIMELAADNGAPATRWGQSWDTDEIRTWLSMSPSLQGINLQDYFWISRESLEHGQAVENIVSKLVADLYIRFRGLQIISLSKDIPNELPKLSKDEKDMLALVMNRDLRKDTSDKRVWGILQADKTGLILDDVQRMNILFDKVQIADVQPLAKPALMRIMSLSEKHKERILKMNFSDNMKRILSKER